MKKHLILFFLSGFTGLVYEVVWQKQMTLVLGASAPAITAILSAFFCGIALGGLVGEKILNRGISALRLYIFSETTILINALLMPLLLKAIDALYVSSGTGSYGLRFILAIIVVLPATTAMGITIPAMSRVLKSRKDFPVATAYGVNAYGGVVGSILSGMILLRFLGAQSTIYVAASINLIVIVMAFLIAKNEKTETVKNEIEKSDLNLWMMAAYFTCGWIALGSEIVWMRMLALMTSNGTLVFSIFLAVYLSGYSIGSLFVFPKLSKQFKIKSVLAFSNFAAALCILVSAWLFYRIPALLDSMVFKAISGAQFQPMWPLFAEFTAIILLSFLPSIFMGVIFPAMNALSGNVGKLYFVGNLGSLAGALMFGLLLIPGIGITSSLMLIVLVSLVLAVIFTFLETQDRISDAIRNISFVVLALAIVSIFTLKPYVKYDHKLEMQNGFYVEYQDGKPKSRILRYKEGQSATVIIREGVHPVTKKIIQKIFIDEQMVASTDPDVLIDSKMLAHLPLMLHPNPKSALTVGYGSGGTSWSMTRYPIQVRAVEIEKEVVNSAHFFEFGKVHREKNYGVILDDARNYLHTTKDKYDVISTDATNVQYKQNAFLYTVEYFKLMKEKLNAGGIACAWIPIAIISPEETKIMMKSFQEVFPHATLWYMGVMPTYFGILVGTAEKTTVDYARVSELLSKPEIIEDTKQIAFTKPQQLASFLLLDESSMRKYTDGVALHTDDYPILEHTATYSFYNIDRHYPKTIEELIRNKKLNDLDFVTGLSPAQKEMQLRYIKASEYWMQAVLYQLRSEYARNTLDKFGFDEAAREQAELAMRITPEDEWGAKWLEKLKAQMAANARH